MNDDYAKRIAARQMQVLVVDGAVMGCLVLIHNSDVMLLDNIAVAPAAQGMGYGRLLLNFAEQQTLAAGYGEIRLYTNAAMTQNIALYSRLGYVETHRAVEHGLHRVFMRKRLMAGE